MSHDAVARQRAARLGSADVHTAVLRSELEGEEDAVVEAADVQYHKVSGD